MEYVVAKLYNELTQFNTFVVNGYICENGAFSALISDKPKYRHDSIMFQYGYSNIISLTYGLPVLFGSQAWDIIEFYVEHGNNYADYTITYSNGQQSKVRAYNRELPDVVETDNLIDVRLIDDRHTNIFVDNDTVTVCVALDVNRVRAGTKDNARIYDYIHRNIPVNFMQLELKERKMRLMPCIMITDNKARLGFVNVDDYKVIPTFGREVDISPIIGYVEELKSKCNIVYGALETY